MPHKFGWTASVELTPPDDVEIQHRNVGDAIADELVGRCAVVRIGLGDPRLGFSFGVDGSSKEEATDNSRQTMGKALARVGINWLKMTKVNVRSNQELADLIKGIDPTTGQMRPTAPVIQLRKGEPLSTND
jgi:hypothetical protein